MHVVTFRLLLISLPKLWMQSFSFLYKFLFAGDIYNVHGVTDNSIVVLYFQRGLRLFSFIIFDV
jgi:hypothetical protein